jgi:hypothetical protein
MPRKLTREANSVDVAEILPTIAEVALGIAGFSSVMTAFMKRPGKLTRIEIYRIAVLLGASLGAMFLAFVPLLCSGLGAGASASWRVSSAAMIVYTLIAGTIYLVASFRVSRDAPEIFNRVLFVAIAMGHLVNSALQLTSVLRADLAVAGGIYLTGLIWFLLHAAVQFSRILFIQPARP